MHNVSECTNKSIFLNSLFIQSVKDTYIVFAKFTIHLRWQYLALNPLLKFNLFNNTKLKQRKEKKTKELDYFYNCIATHVMQ